MKLTAPSSVVKFDVRTKLLVLLALLSLPLLVLSLLQLHSHQRNLHDQTREIARIRAIAAAGMLESWLEDHPAQRTAAATTPLPPPAVRDLYERLRKHTAADAETAIIVVDAQGRAIANPFLPAQMTISDISLAGTEQRKWADGEVRVTGFERVAPFNWGVAVGVPPLRDTPAGRSILMLTATWALALLASSMLAVWAVGRFTKPLRQLAASVSTLGEGRFQERVAVETGDEVGALAGNFNAMAENLQAKFDELQAQREFIAEVLDSLPLGVAVLDSSLAVRKANSTFANLVGRPNEAALTGRGLYEASAGLAPLSEVVEDVRRTRRAFVNYGLPLELVSRREGDEEGAKFWDVILWPMTERGEGSGGMILILSEVSKRVRAEKLATAAFAAEKARAAELASVINQMNEGVVIVDARGRYRINPAAAKIIGRAPGEFRDGVQALIDDLSLCDLKGNKLPPGETPLGRAIERGESVSAEHVLIMRGGKEERILEVSVTPLISEASRHDEGVVGVFRDITEEMRQHNEIVAAYDRLREHDRLKSAFIANVSHELRTPLNVIIGLCQLLDRDRQLPLAPLQTEAVVRMERNARSLLELVNDLLGYSRLEAGRSALHLEKLEVAAIIAEVVDPFTADARAKGVELRVDVADSLGDVWTDRHKLSQVLSNLISNAVKFTRSGAIVVTAAPVGDEHWFLEVSDTGIGMPSDALDYIFEHFRQVDDQLTRSYSGVGLGLAITRKIVELLGGQIEVESRQDEGSRFRITWPRKTHLRTGTGSLLGERDDSAARVPSLRARAG